MSIYVIKEGKPLRHARTAHVTKLKLFNLVHYLYSALNRIEWGILWDCSHFNAEVVIYSLYVIPISCVCV